MSFYLYLQPVSPPNISEFASELSPTEAPRTVKTVASPTSAAVSAMKLLSCSRVARGKLQMIDGITWDFNDFYGKFDYRPIMITFPVLCIMTSGNQKMDR